MIIEELIALLGFDLEGEGDLRRFRDGLQGAERYADRAAKSIGVLGVAVGSVVGTLALRAIDLLGQAVGAIPGGAITAGATFQDLAATLEVIEGSSEKAKASLDWVSKFAAQTPYEIGEVSEAFVRLRSYGLDPTSGLLRSVGDAASAMGKSLMQGVEAVADAVTGENERLKEFGIRAKVAGDQITYFWSENGKEMKKTVRKDAGEIQKALAGIFDAKFYGVMEKRSANFRGILSNISDMWQRFMLKVADAGWFPWVQEQAKGLLDWFKELDEDGTLDRWAENISDALVRTGKGLVSFGRLAKDTGSKVYAAFGRLGGAAGRAAEQLRAGDWRGAASTVVGAIAAEFSNLGAAIRPYVDQAAQALKDRLTAISPEISSAVQSAVALAKEGDWAGASIMAVEAFSRGFSTLSSKLRPYFDAALDAALAIDWSGISDRVVQSFAGISAKIVPAIADSLTSALESIGSLDGDAFGQSLGKDAAQIGEKMGRLVVESFVAQVKTLSGVMGTLAQDLAKLDWKRSAVAWFEAMKAQVNLVNGLFGGITKEIIATIEGWFNIDLTGVGTRWGEQILNGLSGMGAAIREWFASLIPGWAKEFFDTVNRADAGSAAGDRVGGMVPPKTETGKTGRMTGPDDASSRRVRQAFEGGTPANDNSAALVEALNRFVAGLNAVSPPQAGQAAMNTLQQRVDNSVTVGDINSSVNLTVNSNATPAQIAAIARSRFQGAAAGVRNDIQGMGVSGAPSFGGPR